MKKGISPSDWDSLLSELKKELSDEDFAKAEGILFKWATDYL